MIQNTLRILAIGAALSFAGVASAQHTTPVANPSSTALATSTQTAPSQVKGHQVVLNVKGMHCSDCKAKVEAALKKIDGVSAAQANLIRGNVTVTTSKKVADQKLLAAVKGAGFEGAVPVVAPQAPQN